MGSLNQRRILITGGNRGIGAALVRGCHHAGATVIAHARTAESLAPLVDELGIQTVTAELSDTDAGAQIAKQLDGAPIDVLINNAAYEHYCAIEDLRVEDLEQVLRVDLVAPVALSKNLLPNLKCGANPTIINITSIHDTVAVADNSAYAMAKAALHMFTKVAAIEFAEYGIRVNTLAPGAIETDMNREVIESFGRERFNSWIPSGRVGTCDDLMGAIALLAGSESTYMNGTRICIDGGYEHNLLRYRPGREG